MRVQIYMDMQRRALFKNREFMRKFLRCLRCFKSGLFERNTVIFKKLFFSSRIQNICWISGRSKSVYKSYRASRFVLKGVSRAGILPGLRKSNW